MHIYMPLIILIKLTSSHSTHLTHLISLNSSHLCSYIYFFIFIYPSPICFFIKLLTCGVIRSYNFYILRTQNPSTAKLGTRGYQLRFIRFPSTLVPRFTSPFTQLQLRFLVIQNPISNTFFNCQSLESLPMRS